MFIFNIFTLKSHYRIIKMVGKSIKERRKTLRVTQPQVAELADISVNTLYKIERGQANPTLETLTKIADVLGMEVILQVKNLQKLK
ncbi:helix-turn-helix domain-containing protein [Psychroflexus gondwanensis]|jgi:transcriptional regulator with XRE-family HTH domain|uniref:helix-turn-helix domain-containing protein n=1 Tax=Psychroflexus gondwanensis TaxID=251 RepID=UPI00167FF01D|nr:helix-turn-helix transcriptional regulator [Psychroflexus gondwanensis]